MKIFIILLAAAFFINLQAGAKPNYQVIQGDVPNSYNFSAQKPEGRSKTLFIVHRPPY